MGVFKIEGGHTLKGSITPQGAKNEALQVLCAVLLPRPLYTSDSPDHRLSGHPLRPFPFTTRQLLSSFRSLQPPIQSCA